MSSIKALTDNAPRIAMDVSTFWKMLNGLGSEFEYLHALHNQLLVSSERRDVFGTAKNIVSLGPMGPAARSSGSVQPGLEEAVFASPRVSFNEWKDESALAVGSDVLGWRVETAAFKSTQATTATTGASRPPAERSITPPAAQRSISPGSDSRSQGRIERAITPPAAQRSISQGSELRSQRRTSERTITTPGDNPRRSTSEKSITTPGDNPRRSISEKSIDYASDSAQKAKVQQGLIDIFNELDTNGTGSLEARPLRMALVAAGIPSARLVRLFQLADADNSGSIELDEWMQAVTSNDLEMHRLLFMLNQKIEQDGCIISSQPDSSNPFMINPLTYFRILWDCLMTAVCCNIAILLPFSIAWEGELAESVLTAFVTLDRAINYFFLVDIVLNFRTGYINNDGKLIMNWKMVGKHYLSTWFLFDFISSFPTEEIELEVGHLQAVKVLKISRLLKIMRLIRPRNVVISELSDTLDDIVQSKFVQHVLVRKSKVFFYMFLLCHWMACGMKMVDSGPPSGWLTGYENVGGKLWSEYLSALYWAMTTLTTVGYGDLIPISDEERAYTIGAMVVGGGFYGYVVGAITSIVSNSDLNESAYHDRMDLIHAWLNHHRLPVIMKRKLRGYFKHYLAEKSAISEAQVFQDLSHELQLEVGEYLIHEDVKNNPLFDGIGIGSVVQMQSILRRVTVEVGDCLATGGEVGMAMYILVSGSLEMRGLGGDGSTNEYERKGSMSTASWMHSSDNGMSGSGYQSETDDHGQGRSSRSAMTAREIVEGQCFGEEILLGFTEHWDYTVTALEKSKLEMIQQREFFNVFRTMPNILEKIRCNFLLLNPEWIDLNADIAGPRAGPGFQRQVTPFKDNQLSRVL